MSRVKRKPRYAALSRAIRALERSCLAKGYTPTVTTDIKYARTEEVRDYYRWLRQQAPMTALGYPDFDELLRQG